MELKTLVGGPGSESGTQDQCIRSLKAKHAVIDVKIAGQLSDVVAAEGPFFGERSGAFIVLSWIGSSCLTCM
jgi:hypothetical protein